MSSASVHGELPSQHTMLGVLDEQAQLATRAAIRIAGHELSDQAPRSDRAGQHIADQVATRVTKTKTGWQAVANFGRNKPHRGVTAAQVARWVTRGTGLYREGPGPKKKIHAKNRLKRMSLGNGVFLRSVRGQHPNQFATRAKDLAQEGARQALRQGAANAARILAGKGSN